MQAQGNKAGEYIKSNSDFLAKKILDTHLEIQKKYNIGFDEKNTGMYLNGIKYNLAYLSESLLFSSPELFYSALRWGKIFLPKIDIPLDNISFILTAIKETLNNELPGDIKVWATKYLDDAIKKIKEFSTELPSFLEEQKGLCAESRIYLEFLLNNNRMDASKLVLNLINKDAKIKDIYLEIFQPVQYELGRLWQLGIISVAQEHYCTASTQIIMSQLYPYIFQNKKSGNVFIGTCISGELHEIGVRMLSDLLELEGWDTYYLGANMPVDSIIKTIIEKKAKVIGLSATMTFHVEKVEKQIKAIKDCKECRDVRIIVGGYVFKLSKNLWKKVGADAFGEDLTDSIIKINNLIKH